MEYRDLENKITKEENSGFGQEPGVYDHDEHGQAQGDNNQQQRQNTPLPSQSSGGGYFQELIGIEELFDKTLKILKHTIWKIVVLSLIPILGYILTAISGFATAYVFQQEGMMSIAILLGLVTAFAAIAALVLAFVVQAAIYLLIRDAANRPSVPNLLKKAKKHALNIIVINLVAGIFVILWSFLFIIPGIIAAVRYSLAPWVYFYEGLSGTAAINRSKDLINGYTGSVFGRYALLYLIYFLITYIPLLVLNLVNAPEVMMAIWNVVNQVLAFAVGPFFLIYSCYIYWDLVRIKGRSANL